MTINIQYFQDKSRDKPHLSYSFPTELPTYVLQNGMGDGSYKVSSTVLYESFGSAIASLGDINNDGYPDFAVGANNYTSVNNVPSVGRVYMFLGGPQTIMPNQTTNALFENHKAFIIDGPQVEYSLFGSVIANLNDINGDGINDFGIVASNITNGKEDYKGQVFVFYGGYFNGNNITTDSLNGTNGFNIINTNSANSDFSFSLSHVGDVNDDSLQDWGIGNPYVTQPGYGYGSVNIIYGAKYMPASINSDDLPKYGFQIDGSSYSSSPFSICDMEFRNSTTDRLFGYSIAYAGKINNDDIDDLVIGSPGSFTELYYGYQPGYTGYSIAPTGAVYLVYGLTDDLGPIVNSSAINGKIGQTIINTNEGCTFEPAICPPSFIQLCCGSHFGSIVGGNIDINQDGRSELFISDHGKAIATRTSNKLICDLFGGTFILNFENYDFNNTNPYNLVVDIAPNTTGSDIIFFNSSASSYNFKNYFGENKATLGLTGYFYSQAIAANLTNFNGQSYFGYGGINSDWNIGQGFAVWGFDVFEGLRYSEVVGDFNDNGVVDIVYVAQLNAEEQASNTGYFLFFEPPGINKDLPLSGTVEADLVDQN